MLNEKECGCKCVGMLVYIYMDTKPENSPFAKTRSVRRSLIRLATREQLLQSLCCALL